MRNHLIESLFYRLVAIKSDTGTVFEKDVEAFIEEYMMTFEYFKKHPTHMGAFTLAEDAFDRQIVWGLVKRGTSKKTVILLHHHDVVDALDYGALKQYAYTPKDLKMRLNTRKWPQTIQKHLDSEQWIFGRGTADMKAGAAIQLELLREYSLKDDVDGNILLLSVPDEETFSSGMRAGIQLLNDLQKKHHLKYELLIDSEPHEREVDSEGTLYDGSVGKIMPVIYVRGFKSHIGQIFSGLNPLLILSKVIQKTEVNLSFSDQKHQEMSPPPSWSYMKDFKENYDASIPEAAGGYFSVLTMTQTPKAVLEALKSLCIEAFEEAIELVNRNYRGYHKVGEASLQWQPRVKYFSELHAEVLGKSGERYQQSYESLLVELKQLVKEDKITLPESNFRLIRNLLKHSSSNEPTIVISLSPPYYPHISSDAFDSEISSKELLQTINETCSKYGEKYRLQKYFMGISDMSYTGLINDEEVIPYIQTNMPLWESVYSIDFEGLKALGIPSINLGPWGLDLHKMTERVYAPDVFKNTPELICGVIDKIL